MELLGIAAVGGALAFGPAAWAQEDGEDDATAAPPAAAPAQDRETLQVPTPDPRESAVPVDENWFLLGRYGNIRTDLLSNGISFDIQWTQSFQSVVDGGRDTGFAYGGSLDYLIDLNLDQMGVMPGAFVRMLAETRYGESVNGDAGGLLPVNTDLSFPLNAPPDDNIGIAITQLTYTQFLSEKFAVLLGKFQTLDGDANEFASGRGRTQFSNAAFIFNPTTALMVPYSALGGGVLFLPSPNIAISSLVMNTADSSTSSGFGDFGDGWTWATEASFQYKLGELPGGQVVTFIYAADGEFTNFSRADLLPGTPLFGTNDDTWTLTWSGWQYLYTPDEVPDRLDTANGRPDLRGVGLFGRVGVADDDTNPIDLTFSLGVGGRGLIAGRDDDLYGLAFNYTDFNTTAVLAVAGFGNDAYGFEAFYNFDLGRGLSLTANLQVLDPVPSAPGTTTVIGARLNVRF
jgi:porin